MPTTTNDLNIKTSGIVDYNGSGVFEARTVTQTSNKTAVSNGSGVSGDPTIALASIVNLSTQPCFGVSEGGNLTNKTGDGTAFVVTWDTELFDQGNNFSSPTFTAPIAGVYAFYATVRMTGLGAGNTTGSLSITQNGTVVSSKNINPFAVYSATTLIANISVEGIIKASANDTFEVVYTVSGGTKIVGIQGSQAFNFFVGNLILF